MLLIIHWLLYNDYLYTYLHLQFWQSRRSRIHKQPPEVFLKFFANFTGKHLCWSLFFTKLQAFRPATLLKIDSYTGVFLWNLRNSEEHLYFEEHLNDSFCVLITSSYIGFYNPLSGIPEFLDSGRESWTLDSGLWTLDATLRKLGSGH